jgi:hypothetical protein
LNYEKIRRFDDIFKALENISKKQKVLERNNHAKASAAALQIITDIQPHINSYLSADKPNIKDFYNECTTVINNNKSELEKHRGWTRFLGNLVLAIATLGIGYIAFGLINQATTGNFLFFNPQTHSSKLLAEMEKKLLEVKEVPDTKEQIPRC